jgi:hypothetical protein
MMSEKCRKSGVFAIVSNMKIFAPSPIDGRAVDYRSRYKARRVSCRAVTRTGEG